ncbi:MAG: hypothetical protein ACE5F6_18055 [Anaerolineae bacterium]
MPHCPSALAFSETHAGKRILAAQRALGEEVVCKLLAYALFLMGGRREAIAQHLGLPLGTLFSLLTRITRLGLPALEDRRHTTSQFLPPAAQVPKIELASGDAGITVDLGAERVVSLAATHPLQSKVFLLTLLDHGLLDLSQVAELLGYSQPHTARLVRQLREADVPALIDKRQGQQQEYRVTPAVKAELIQQFVVDVIARGRTSGEAISEALQERGIHIPARTVRHHLVRLGLPAIRHSLPQLLAEVKKTSSASC